MYGSGQFSKILVLCLVALLAGLTFLFYHGPSIIQKDSSANSPENAKIWHAPDTATIPRNDEGNLIRYGRDLIARTSYYLGPRGKVMNISNGMNCQNCHLEAGTKFFGNNYGSVAATYPRFRPRSGHIDSIEKRVNDCLERSLNGKALDSLSKEMRAIISYVQWLGTDIPRGTMVLGSGLADLQWLERAADPTIGKQKFVEKCRVCHGSSGEGLRLSANSAYIYPPTSGENSFNTGAGLYRISSFAKYIRANMPNGATYENPILTAEESWDIAAYVVSQPRPRKNFTQDWPKINSKPIDYPFGPYADNFSEEQHKYGPFKPMMSKK